MGLFSAIAPAAISGISSLLGGNSANKAAAKQAQQQMAFQKETLQHQHQWEVDDLRAAGLNPILSANAGAGSASGAQAPIINALGEAGEASVSSAQAGRRLAAELENMEASNDKIKSDTSLNRALQTAAKADAVLKINNARVASNNADISAADLPIAALKQDAFSKVVSTANSARSLAQTVARNPGLAAKTAWGGIKSFKFPNPLNFFGGK